MNAPSISSPANPRIKAAVRLRERRERAETGLTLVDGAREIARAVVAGIVVETAFVAPGLLRTPESHEALEALRTGAVEVAEVSEAVLARLAFGDRSDGIVAVIRIPPTGIERLDLPSDPLVVVVEGVEKPGNLGAVLRSADGAGADAVIAAGPGTDLFNPNTIRASLGTIFSVPLATAGVSEARAWLVHRGIRIVAARVDGTVRFGEGDLTGPLAIVLGSEAAGLSDAWEGPGVEAVALPMRGVGDSLNVSATAAVLLYEALRQRSLTADPAD